MFEIIESLFRKLQDKKWIAEDTETLPAEAPPSAPPRERPDKPVNPVVPGPSTNPKPKATARDVALFVRNHNLAESVTEAEAIHPDKQEWIKKGDELVNQILPKVKGKRKTYLQTIAKESYNELVAKIQQYTGIELEDSTLPAVLQLVVQAVREVLRIEKQHTNYLEEWAVMLPLQLKEFKLVEEAHTAGTVKFDAKLANPDFEGKMTDAIAEPEEEDELTAGEELNMDLAQELAGITEQDIQRRFANMLISGGAGLKLYLYNLMNDRLTGINPKLPNLYGMMACLAQLGYWVTPDGIEAGNLESTGAGIEELEGDEVKTIKAVGICFPYLVHEVVKGIYEWLALSGEQHAEVSQRVDKLSDETHDLMVGGKVWQAVNSYVGAEEQELMPLVQKEVIKLQPAQIQAVLAKGPEGKKIMDDILARSREAYKTYQDQKEEYAKESLVKGLYFDLNQGTVLEESLASIMRALKAGEVNPEQYKALIHADPSPGKIYVDWMKKIMLKEKLKPEELQSYFDGLHTFYILAANQNSPFQAQERNIASYKSMDDLNAKTEHVFDNLPNEQQGEIARNIRRKVLRKEVDRLPSEKKYRVPRNLNDMSAKNREDLGKPDPRTGKPIKDTTSTVVQFENDKCIIYMPRTKERSIYYGAFGGWCTAKPAGENQFHTYWDKDEALLYVIPKGKFASASNNWCIQMDPNGKPMTFWDFQDHPHEPNTAEVKAMLKRLDIEV
jgi:hypothetical protein